jgi:hypothetical protein
MGINGRRQGNDKPLDRYFRFDEHPADCGKLFKIIKALYGLMGLQFSAEAEPMGAGPCRVGILHIFLYG